jgi:hypothetical protein
MLCSTPVQAAQGRITSCEERQLFVVIFDTTAGGGGPDRVL